MDHKELIRQLRAEADSIRESDRNAWAAGYEQAATAIETLLEEREAASRYIPRGCSTCQWWEAGHCTIANKAAKCGLEFRELWKWRGPQKGETK